MKHTILSLENLDKGVILFKFKREKNLMKTLNSLFDEFHIHYFEAMITQEHTYLKEDPFNTHIIVFPKSIMLIFYLKKISKNKLTKRIAKDFEFKSK